MKTVIARIDAANPDNAILERAAGEIKRGRIIVCPTDTGYAFAASAVDTRAIAMVFQLKGRSFSNPIHIAVGSLDEAEKYAEVSQAARILAERYLPGGLTLVLPRKKIVPSILLGGRQTVGIRIPDCLVMLRLIGLVGLPLTATSANISGQATPFSVAEIVAQYGENIPGVPLVLDQGQIPGREVSTIVDLTVQPPQLIRQGRISWPDICQTLALKGC